MLTPRRECDDKAPAVNNLEHIIRVGCQISAALSGAQTVGNLRIVPQSLEADLGEVGGLIQGAECQDTFYSLVDSPFPGDHRT